MLYLQNYRPIIGSPVRTLVAVAEKYLKKWGVAQILKSVIE